ncbi:MAG: cytochrome c family protein [bacterium]
MKKFGVMIGVTILTSITIMLFSINNYAQDSGKFKYTGSKKCKVCHSSPKSGAQFKQWESSKHAKAYETLASEEAKKIGAEKGIANPQNDAQCLKCHVTAYGIDASMLDKGYNMADGVGCESCHGAGEGYWKKKDMEDIAKGAVEGATLGLVKPTEETCKTCHNEGSPTFKGFNFVEMFKQVNHMIPDDYKKEKGYK